jgi:predicted DNA-binding transcriptional regulator AlpA
MRQNEKGTLRAHKARALVSCRFHDPQHAPDHPQRAPAQCAPDPREKGRVPQKTSAPHKVPAPRNRFFRKRGHIAAKEDDPAEPPARPASGETLLSDLDLEELTGVKQSTWQKKRIFGGGPPFIRLGRMVRYRRSEVEAWLAAIPSLRSTSQADA